MIASPAELDAFLREHPEIEFFEVFFTSMAGVPRGKRLRRHEMKAVYDYGRFLPGSILVVDLTGQDVEDTGLVWEDGDADRRARPVPGGIVPAPWLGMDVGQVMLSMYELDGAPNDLDPRHVLRRVLDRFAADGLTPVVACELEFYLLDARRTRDGGVALPKSRVDGRRAALHEVYGLPEVEEASPYLRDLWNACDDQDVPLEGVISEYAPGQLELTLKHKADALRAADEAVLYKRAAKGVARTHGLTACFMAKPFSDRAGCGLHLHMSFNDAEGRNACASEDPQGTPLLRHAIAGMQALLPESLAILAPNANSYRRFKANSYAPVSPTWGVNNRTVSLRIPAGLPPTRHVEHRLSGADANPYLALAAVLAAAHYGIAHKLDPGRGQPARLRLGPGQCVRVHEPRALATRARRLLRDPHPARGLAPRLLPGALGHHLGLQLWDQRRADRRLHHRHLRQLRAHAGAALPRHPLQIARLRGHNDLLLPAARVSGGAGHRLRLAQGSAVAPDGGDAAVLDQPADPHLCVDGRPARPGLRQLRHRRRLCWSGEAGRAHRRALAALRADPAPARQLRRDHRPRLRAAPLHGAAALRRPGSAGSFAAGGEPRPRPRPPFHPGAGGGAAVGAWYRIRGGADLHPLPRLLPDA